MENSGEWWKMGSDLISSTGIAGEVEAKLKAVVDAL